MQEKTHKPLGFWRTALASATGVILAGAILSLVGTILMIALVAALVGGSSTTGTTAPQPGTYLKIDLTNGISEVAPDALQSLTSGASPIGLTETVQALYDAADDENVLGAYLLCSGASGIGWGAAEELRDALVALRNAGKAVVCYGESYSQPEYYVASVGSKVCLHTDGMIDLRGIGAQVMYYKDLFDRLGVSVELIRPASCAYKSAGETYTMNHMSAANREQVRQYIGSIWDHVAFHISLFRQQGNMEQFQAKVDNLQGCLAHDALREGLVDTLCHASDVERRLKDHGSHIVPISTYPAATSQSRDKVALIVASGTVQTGKYPGYGDGIYTDRTVRAIERAANDKRVKAIVLRVNSPGGAATTSQSITAAVRQAREKKPIVVSMGDYAASAGYEISCLAHRIVAQPTTITGSIGVFGTIPEVGQMLKKKLGLTFDTVSTNRNSNGLSLVRPLSPQARQMMQRNVDEFYHTFVSTVAEGRLMRYKQVDSIARGHVWSGRDALELGLVDTLGGLHDAIAIAARLGKTNDYTLVRYPQPQTLSEQIATLLDGESQPLILARNPEERLLHDLRPLCQAPTLQARLPYTLIIE